MAKTDFVLKKKLDHVAFIMDGNGRWAKARGLPRTAGHKAGCDRIIDIYEECLAQDIKVMSLYAFSTPFISLQIADPHFSVKLL